MDDSQQRCKCMENIPHVISALQDQQKAIKLCIDHKLSAQAAALVYMGIDHLAYLSISMQDNVTRSDFCAFVEIFFDPEKILGCDPLDLYGARCGILHNYSAESSLFRKGKVKQITYARGTAKAELANAYVVGSEWDYLHCIQIEQLLECYANSLTRVVERAANDPEFERRLNERGRAVLSHLSEDAMRSAVAASKP